VFCQGPGARSIVQASTPKWTFEGRAAFLKIKLSFTIAFVREKNFTFTHIKIFNFLHGSQIFQPR
jgi:hypothetical protein